MLFNPEASDSGMDNNMRPTLEKHLESLLAQCDGVSLDDAKRLAANALGITFTDFHFERDRHLTREEAGTIAEKISRRAASEPLQYIEGKVFFRHLQLVVGPGVLIPRPETEIMVDLAINLAPPKPLACDLGTGSGAVAIALATEIPDSEVIGVDISPKALAFARINKTANHADNLELRQGDLFEPVPDQRFDIVTANLPYVPNAVLAELPREIREFEPETALRGGADGLDIIKRAISEAPDHLYPGGIVILEISPEQADPVLSLLQDTGFENVEMKQDLNRLDRFAVGAIP